MRQTDDKKIEQKKKQAKTKEKEICSLIGSIKVINAEMNWNMKSKMAETFY